MAAKLVLVIALFATTINGLSRLDVSNSSGWKMTTVSGQKVYTQTTGQSIPISFVIELEPVADSFSVQLSVLPSTLVFQWCAVSTWQSPQPLLLAENVNTVNTVLRLMPVYLTCMPSQPSAGVSMLSVSPVAKKPNRRGFLKIEDTPAGIKVGFACLCTSISLVALATVSLGARAL